MVLPRSCRRAVITLLPKKGDLQKIKNWRPVALLCTDYKILSKALANRLREVMDLVVHQDQTYCVPGRSILDNVSLIRDILDISSSLGIDTGLISLDKEKAFDLPLEDAGEFRPQPRSYSHDQGFVPRH